MIKNKYTTDGKVVHLSTEDEINNKIAKVLGQKFIDYRKKWDLANKLELVTEFPLFLHIELNQTCNYKCPHCIIGNPDEVEKLYNKKENLTFEQYKKIVDEGAKHNCPSITAQGDNEPFLIKNMEEYIYYAHKKGFIDIMTNTNGSPITANRSKKILDSGLTRIRFSLDAYTDKTYKKVRVGAIDLDKVKRNIFNFLDLKEKGGYKLPVVGVSFCKLKQNENEVEEFTNYWRDKVDIISIQKFMPPTPNKEKYKEYYSSDQYHEKVLDKFNCVQPYQRLVIKNDSIYPCCVSFNKNLVLGSIKNTKIYDAWHSKKMNELREIHKRGTYKEDKTCKTCVELIYPPKAK